MKNRRWPTVNFDQQITKKKKFFQKRFLPGDFRKRFGKKQKFVQKIDPTIYLNKIRGKNPTKKSSAKKPSQVQRKIYTNFRNVDHRRWTLTKLVKQIMET